MTTATTFAMDGKAGEKMNLPKEVFEIKAPATLLAQAVRVYLNNQRKARAKTKTRTDVNKTTAKLFKQKGTGHARHGSKAAPIFVGGGVSHGPDGHQNFHRFMTKTMARKALLGALSLRAGEKLCVVLTGTEKPISKAKEATNILKQVGEKMISTLVIATPEQKEISRAFKNLKLVHVLHTNQLNTYSILAHQNIVLTDLAVEQLKKQYV